ncbi:MAG: hypothetical protein ACYTHM_12740 [Planctomycetota bacterium]|jgi:chromosome segregation ATPase
MADTPESTDDLTIAEDLEEIKGELTAIFHGQGQRVTEFRVVVSQGLQKLQEDLQALLNSAKELARRNNDILSEAEESEAASERFANLQGEIDGQLADLKRVNKELGDACELLRSQREDQSRLRKDNTDQNETTREDIHKLTTDIDRLGLDNDAIHKELETLQRKKDTLQKEVDVLQAKRQEFLTELAKYKEVKSSLLG